MIAEHIHKRFTSQWEMMETLLRNFAEQIRFADVLDIAIMSALLYITLVWLRDRASRSLGIVAGGLGVVFLLSQWLDLYLTAMLFRFGWIAILVAMVVVFQTDLRHGFERLVTSRLFSRKATDQSKHQSIDTIVEGVASMAEQRIGALIVFPGREPLDRHLSGGVAVDAKISLPLLLSVFHPKSPGHDGAILIEQDRIAFLGLHLPLTTQVRKVHDGGTRHAAALGLAEICDALVVVVSEERGTITIANEGELEVVEPADLSDRLQIFAGDKAVQSQTPPIKRFVNWLTKLAAISTAVTLWFLIAFHTDTIQRTYVLPIEYRNLPEHFEIVEPMPRHAEVTLSGPETAFAVLDPTTATVSLEVNHEAGKKTQQWQTQANLKNVPAELTVEQITPKRVAVSLRPKQE